MAATLFAVLVMGTAAPTADAEGFTSDTYRLRVSGPYQPAVHLYVEEAGRGRPVVLLHGLGASGYSWRRVAPILARHFRVISIDLRGHGRSDAPFDQAYAPTAQAELVRDAMRQLDLSRAIVVGHSFGGLVALIATLQETAERPRDTLIDKLVLMNTPAYPQPPSAFVAFLRKPILPYLALSVVPATTFVTLALTAETIGMGHITDEDIAMYADPLNGAGARHALIQSARLLEPQNAGAIIAHYGLIRQPALIIWCRKDQIVPLSTGERLTRDLRNSTLAVIDHCEHATPEAAPALTSKLIMDFAR